MSGLEEVLGAVRSDPASVGLFTDFDGTLSEIRTDPSAVVPVDGVVEPIDALAQVLGRVAIVSGRAVSFLHGFFADEVELSGLYGIEHWADGRLLIDRTAIDWLPIVQDIAKEASDAFGAEFVEDKTYSLTLHYRGAPDDSDFETRMHAWVKEKAALFGLEARVARMSYEMHPPIGRTKADALHDMLRGLTAAVYIGDDRGDRPAFEMMSGLIRSGRLSAGASVLVRSDETPLGLEELVTDVIDGPAKVPFVLDTILSAAT